MEITADVKGHFLRLYQMAMTDGNFSKLEWKVLYDFAQERQIPKEELDKILLSTTGPIPIPEKVEVRIEYLYDLTRMIWADGVVSPYEKQTLIKYARIFEFEESNLESLADYLIEKVKEGISKNELLKELN